MFIMATRSTNELKVNFNGTLVCLKINYHTWVKMNLIGTDKR